MLRFFQILVSAIVLASSAVSLSACGQQGPLYLPTEPAAANRATLPETLFRIGSAHAPQSDTQAVQSPAKPPAHAAPATTSVPQ